MKKDVKAAAATGREALRRIYWQSLKALYRHQAWEAWSDFCALSACAIANAVDKRHYQTREKMYLDTIKRYNKQEQEVFPVLFAETVLELERNPDQDFLGKMFMQLELGNQLEGAVFHTISCLPPDGEAQSG